MTSMPTSLQIKTLFVYKHLKLKTGLAPSLREIALFQGVTQKAIFDRFNGLIAKGLAEKCKGSRGLKITVFGEDLMEDFGYDPQTDTLYNNRFHRDLCVK